MNFALKSDKDIELQHVVNTGHEWIELDENTTDEEAALVSEWLNADQQQNNSNSEASLIRVINNAIQDAKLLKQSLKIGQIVAKIQENWVLKVSGTNVAQLAKFVLDLEHSWRVEEYLNFHSLCVEPTELAAPPSLFEEISKLPENKPLLKINVAQVAYEPSCRIENIRPTPDRCNFITTKHLAALGKDIKKCDEIEAKLESNRSAFLEELSQRGTGKGFALNAVRIYEHNVIRGALCLPMTKEMLNAMRNCSKATTTTTTKGSSPSKSAGSSDALSVPDLHTLWVYILETNWPHLRGIGMKCGVDISDLVTTAAEGDKSQSLGDDEVTATATREHVFVRSY